MYRAAAHGRLRVSCSTHCCTPRRWPPTLYTCARAAAMDEEMARDDKVFIMGEEVAEYQVRAQGDV